MRQLFFAVALLLAACATPSAHADALASDPAILTSCVAEAGKDRDELLSCALRMARACIAEEGGSNSMSGVLCIAAEADVWQSLIDEKTVRSYRAYEYGGGSGEQFDRVSCHLHLTVERAINLIAD